MYFNTITANMCTFENQETLANLRKTAKRKRKHIPHAQRPSEYVEKRNRRERIRIRSVNEAFEKLRRKVPSCGQDPELRISKMEVLTHAISYIEDLCRCLGYGGFEEYWRHEGQFTRAKENPGSGFQEQKSGISDISRPSFPVYNGGLKERQTNTAGITSLPPVTDLPLGPSPFIHGPSTPDYSHPARSSSCHYPNSETINFVNEQSFEFESFDVINSCYTRHLGCGELQHDSQYERCVHSEPSYFPCVNDMNHGSLATFPRISKIDQLNSPFYDNFNNQPT